MIDIEKLIKKLPLIKDWINDTLSKHKKEAKLIKDFDFGHLHLYFSDKLLSTTKAIELKTGRIPKPSLSKMGLSEFSNFENRDDDGITYNDMYFIKSKRFHDESIHFHELIHVIQWKYYGFDKFLLAIAEEILKYKYGKGPLEFMAYKHQDFFECLEAYDAEKEVHSELNKLKIDILSQADILLGI